MLSASDLELPAWAVRAYCGASTEVVRPVVTGEQWGRVAGSKGCSAISCCHQCWVLVGIGSKSKSEADTSQHHQARQSVFAVCLLIQHDASIFPQPYLLALSGSPCSLKAGLSRQPRISISPPPQMGCLASPRPSHTPCRWEYFSPWPC
jgi:hypothetical protein